MYSGLISFSESGILRKDRGEITSKPYLTAVRTKEMVTLNFEMDGHKSIIIYCRRGKEEAFTQLAEVTKGPFFDTRPNLTEYSETREYKAVFSVKGEAVGDPDYLQIKTKGRFRFF